MSIDFSNICDNYYENKDIIIALFIEYYGGEYEDISCLIKQMEEDFNNRMPKNKVLKC